MSVTIKAHYVGDNTVELEHGPTGRKMTTDLPLDNGGKGRTFSPTDLLASALASCILTIMGMAAAKDGSKHARHHTRTVASSPAALLASPHPFNTLLRQCSRKMRSLSSSTIVLSMAARLSKSLLDWMMPSSTESSVFSILCARVYFSDFGKLFRSPCIHFTSS